MHGKLSYAVDIPNHVYKEYHPINLSDFIKSYKWVEIDELLIKIVLHTSAGRLWEITIIHQIQHTVMQDGLNAVVIMLLLVS